MKTVLPNLLFLLACTASQAQIPGALPGPIGEGGAAPSPALVQRDTHSYGGGPAPRVTCGTATFAGTDTAGIINLSMAWNPAGDFCFVEFARQWTNMATPVCIVTAQGSPTAPNTPTTLVFTVNYQSIAITSGAAPGARIVYHCIGAVVQ